MISRIGSLRFQSFFKQIYQEIGLQQYLVIQAVHIGISVVMTDQIADAVDNGGAETEERSSFSAGSGRFLFLQLAVAVSILFFGGFNPDIVYNCGGFQNKLGIALQILRQPNQTREAVNLDKVLNPFRIAGVVANHFH